MNNEFKDFLLENIDCLGINEKLFRDYINVCYAHFIKLQEIKKSLMIDEPNKIVELKV